MKVKLIQTTQNPIDVMWTAARTCYASESPIDIWNDSYQAYLEPNNVLTDACEQQENKQWKLVQQVLNSGHLSIAEHVTFTFAIEGISHACSHQLVGYRHCTFSQQSQRYVEIKESLSEIESHREHVQRRTDCPHCQWLSELVNKYFVVHDSDEKYFCEKALCNYLELIEDGAKPEDARAVLPNATKTNLVMTLNYRELMHICNERLCTRAQTEIRQLTKLMVEEVKKQDERLSQYLVPKCEIDGFCKEHKCCGRKPTLKSIQEQL